jgi:uncharacterized iron-regulated membrane protein
MDPRNSAIAIAWSSADALGRARRVLRQCHLWVSLLLSLPLIVLGVTGSVLVFGNELRQLMNPPPGLRLESGRPHAVAEVIDAAQAAADQGYAPFLYQPPAAPDQPAAVGLMTPGRAVGRPRVIEALVDPVSLRVVINPHVGLPGLMRVLVDLHGNLLLGRAGRAYVGWLGVALLGLGASGLILWWPRRGRWRAAFLIKRGARGLRLHRDIHGATGIWTLLVFMAVTASGVYLVFPETVGGGIRELLPSHELDARPPAVRAGDTRRIDADQAIAVGLAASPGARLLGIWLPLRPDQPYRVSMAHPDDDTGAPDMVAMVDPWSGELLRLTDPARFAPAQKVIAWQQKIHFGRGLGWVWRILVCLSGLLPAIFAYTGVAMWLIRRRARRRACDFRMT